MRREMCLRMRTDKSYARYLKAPRRARKGLAHAKGYLGKSEFVNFYDAVSKTLQDYLIGRLNLAKGNIAIDMLEEKLLSAGCDESVLGMLRHVFANCEMARYASSVSGEAEAAKVLEEVEKVIDALEKIKM